MKKYDKIFPIVVNNTIRNDLVRCEKRAYWKHELGLEPLGGTKIDLHAGGAFAHGMEAVRRAFHEAHKSEADAVDTGIKAVYDFWGNVETPKGSKKTVEAIAGAIAFYFDSMNYGLEMDVLQPLTLTGGCTGIELPFEFTLPVMHPDRKRHLRLVGRFDLLALDFSGDVWVVDEKTTGTISAKWANQWAMDSQITSYVWAAQRLLDTDAIKRGLMPWSVNMGADTGKGGGQSSLAVGRHVVGAVIRGIGIGAAGYSTMEVRQLRAPWECLRWYNQMCGNFKDWAAHAAFNDRRNMAMAHTCSLYTNPCEYTQLCKSEHPERHIEGNYEVSFWNPVDRTRGGV